MKRKNTGTTKYKVTAVQGEKKTPYKIVEISNKEKNIEFKALGAGHSVLYMAKQYGWGVTAERL